MDLSPLFKSAIGFDRLFELAEHAGANQALGDWPPYDIVKTGEDAYRITMAVAGFTPDEVNVICAPNLLVVTGGKAPDDTGDYLHRGIAARAFKRQFELADFVEVESAVLENGLLMIKLVRELPESMKPRRIEITRGSTAAETAPRQIEGGKQAA